MNQKNQRIRTRFARETRFDVPAVPFRATQTSELERLKNRLLRQDLAPAGDTEHNVLLRRAANEAAALVWLTPFPLLLFPELLREKARAVLLQHNRQARVRRRSLNLMQEAA